MHSIRLVDASTVNNNGLQSTVSEGLPPTLLFSCIAIAVHDD